MAEKSQIVYVIVNPTVTAFRICYVSRKLILRVCGRSKTTVSIPACALVHKPKRMLSKHMNFASQT